MKLKLYLAALFLLLSKCNAYSQDVTGLKIPPGWTAEKFALPPSFAPGITFKGNEEIAFSPQWAKKKTEGYWTYCYLWKLNGNPKLNKAAFERALTIYYTRLVITNLTLANIDSAYAIPMKVAIHQLKADGDIYEGKVTMLDYMAQEPIMLNIRVRIKTPETVFFELSPLPRTNHYWAIMDKIGQ